MTAPPAREPADPPSPPERRPPRRGCGSSPSTYAAPAGDRAPGLLRFARRAGLAAAGLAGVVLAAGLALAPPAQAQSTTEIWSATMTPGSIVDSVIVGWDGVTGSLDFADRTFSYNNKSYTFRYVQHVVQASRDQLVVNVQGSFDAAAKSDLILVVDTVEFPLADASISTSNSRDLAIWEDSGLSWSAGTDVSLSLKAITGRPELRLGSQVRSSGDLWLFFDENLSDALPPKSAFSITADGSPISVGSVSHPQGDGLRLSGLSPSIGEDQRVRLRYTDPTAGDDTNAIQDTGGVDAASFTISDVTNHSSITLPALSAAAVPADGGTVALTFSRDLDFSGTFTATIRDAFSVTVDGTANAVTGFSGSGKTATLTVSDEIERGQTVVVGYDRSDAGGEALADDDDDKKQVADFTTGEDGVPAVTNNSTAGPAKLASVTVPANGQSFTLTFDKDLNAASTGLADQFTATADGVAVRISGSSGLGSADDNFTLLVSTSAPIYKDEEVVVTYVKPTGSDGLTDEANDLSVASFTTGAFGVPAVTNNSTVVAPPSPDTTDSLSKVVSGGDVLSLTFDGPLQTSNPPAKSAFSLTADGYAIAVGGVSVASTATVGRVTLSGLSPAVRQGETVALTYTDPTTGNDTNALQSPTGADVRTFTVTLTNDSTVTIGPPRPPTGLTATALGATIVDLAWTAPADDGGSAITGYKVEGSLTGTSGWSDLAADTGNANAWYRHSGLSSGDTRHYRVSAINAQGTSPASATADATTMTVTVTPVDDEVPEPPEAVRVSGAVSGADIADPEPVTLGIANDDDLEPFDVAVEGPAQVGESDGAARVTVTLTTQGMDRPAFDAHLRYAVQPGTATRGEDWTAPSGTEAGTHSVLFATVPPGSFRANAQGNWEARRSFTLGIVNDAEREAAETVVFRVDTGSRTYQSAPHTITIVDDDGPPGAPEKPALAAVQGSFTSLEARWDEPALDGAAAVTGYDLEYREGAGGAWTEWRHEDASTTARLTGLAAETAYRVRVRALNGAEAGGWSPASEEVHTGAYTIRGICSRSPRVEARIMLRLKYKHGFKGSCRDVTEVELRTARRDAGLAPAPRASLLTGRTPAPGATGRGGTENVRGGARNRPGTALYGPAEGVGLRSKRTPSQGRSAVAAGLTGTPVNCGSGMRVGDSVWPMRRSKSTYFRYRQGRSSAARRKSDREARMQKLQLSLDMPAA